MPQVRWKKKQLDTHYVYFTTPHGVFQDAGVGLFCRQRWSIVFFIMSGKIGGFDDVVDKQVGFFLFVFLLLFVRLLQTIQTI